MTILGNTGTLVKTGYTFGGWTLSSTAYQPGDKYTIPSNITFVAVWIADTPSGGSGGSGGGSGGSSSGGGSVTTLPTITFNPNYPGPATTSQNGNGTVTLLPNSYKRTGYVFKGWSKSPTGPVQILDGGTLSVTEDVTLYAIWEAEPTAGPATGPHVVLFNSNCAPRKSEKQSNAGLVKLNTNSFVCSGSEFLGWATSADGPVAYKDGAVFDFSANAVLYAVWKKAGTPVVAPKTGEMRFEVYFGMNSVIVTSAEKKNIAAQVALLKSKAGANAKLSIVIEGWVQPNPNPGNIKFLSTYRAKHVQEELLKLGVKASYKLLFQGLGADNFPKARHASVVISWTSAK